MKNPLNFGAIRYLLVGVSLAALDVSIYLALVAGGMPQPIAQIISRVTGAIAGFLAHRLFTFPSDERAMGDATQGAGYSALIVWGVLLGPAMVVSCTWLLGGWIFGGKILSDILLAAQNFLILRWVFRAPKSDDDAPTSDTTPEDSG